MSRTEGKELKRTTSNLATKLGTQRSFSLDSFVRVVYVSCAHRICVGVRYICVFVVVHTCTVCIVLVLPDILISLYSVKLPLPLL